MLKTYDINTELSAYSYNFAYQITHHNKYKSSTNNVGDRIVLPNSIVIKLTNSESKTPYTFELSTNALTETCGLLDFTSEDDTMYLPNLLFNKLKIEEGKKIDIVSVLIPPGKKIVLECEKEFLELTNPKTVIEYYIRNFVTLTKNKTIKFTHAKREYELTVKTVEPNDKTILLLNTKETTRAGMILAQGFYTEW